MRNIKITIEYEGTNYSGWQCQENAISIQEKIQEAIKTVTGEDVKLIGSGRTDSKVHALGQVANFYTNSDIPADRYKYALNYALPDDITILESSEAKLDFHARFSATHKEYKYVIYNGEMPRALLRNFSYHVKQNLDVKAMSAASEHFVGTHDFKGFMGSRSQVNSTIRTINKIDIFRDGQLINIIVDGNSFLRNMIRIIVGTLVDVGKGNIEPSDIEDIVLSKNRVMAGATAPPQGLYLKKVFYD